MVWIVINILQLSYISTTYHYTIFWIIFQDSPMLVLGLLYLLKHVSGFNSLVIKINYYSLFFYLLLFYILFMSIKGIINGYGILNVLDESYHLWYYILFFLFYQVIQTDKNMKVVIITLIVVASIISFQILKARYILGIVRFSPFQSDLLPVVANFLFAYILTKRNKLSVKILLTVLLLVLILVGILLTLTRILWVSSIIGLIITYFVYTTRFNKPKMIKFILYLFLIILPVILLGSGSSVNSKLSSSSVSYRAQTITNPTQDLSFLMRVEIGYYVVRKIKDNFIFGTGLGDGVKYKLLNYCNEKVHYPDNLYLYIFWKGGVIGFIIFFVLYYRMLKLNCIIIKKIFYEGTDDSFLSLGIFSSILTFLILGLLQASPVKYKYGILIPIFWGYIYAKGKRLLEF